MVSCLYCRRKNQVNSSGFVFMTPLKLVSQIVINDSLRSTQLNLQDNEKRSNTEILFVERV